MWLGSEMIQVHFLLDTYLIFPKNRKISKKVVPCIKIQKNYEKHNNFNYRYFGYINFHI